MVKDTKKILVSDYDGTFLTDYKNFKLNIKAVNSFTKNNNIFVIATGRNFESIVKEVKKYDIPCQYIISNDGAIVYDNCQKKIIKEVTLDNELISLLLENNKIKVIGKFDINGLTDNVSKLIGMFLKNSSGFNNNINDYIKLGFNIKLIRTIIGSYLVPNTNKTDGIEFIRTRENALLSDIYTVGDSRNDLEMLKKYNGYRMLTSYPWLYFKNLSICREVHTLIKKI